MEYLSTYHARTVAQSLQRLAEAAKEAQAALDAARLHRWCEGTADEWIGHSLQDIQTLAADAISDAAVIAARDAA